MIKLDIKYGVCVSNSANTKYFSEIIFDSSVQFRTILNLFVILWWYYTYPIYDL